MEPGDLDIDDFAPDGTLKALPVIPVDPEAVDYGTMPCIQTDPTRHQVVVTEPLTVELKPRRA